MIARCFAFMLITAALAGCGRGGLVATLDAPIQLAPGESADFAAEKLQVKFVSIGSDSRCPHDVACVWAGEVAVRLAVRKEGRTKELEIKETQNLEVEGYTLSVLQVQPPRASSQPIAPADYRVTLKVTRPGSR